MPRRSPLYPDYCLIGCLVAAWLVGAAMWVAVGFGACWLTGWC